MTPTNEPMSEAELREVIRERLTKTWLLSNQIWCSDATGMKKETVKFPQQKFKVGPSEKVLDELMQVFAAHLQAAVGEAEKQGIVKGIKLVDEALLDDVTGSYPVQVVRNLIKMLIYENTPKADQLTQPTPKSKKEK